MRSIYPDAYILNLELGCFRDLGVCAAVCKDWTPRSRSIQFKSLDLSAPSSPNRLERFFRLLSSPQATIPLHVLQIAMPLVLYDTDIHDDLMIDGTMMRRLAPLRALQSVIFKGDDEIEPVDIDPGTIVAIIDTLRSLPDIVSLELVLFKVESFDLLQQMVVVCPGLLRLYISDVDVFGGGLGYGDDHLPVDITPPNHTGPPPLPCPSLQLLSVVRSSFSGDLFEWIGMLPLSPQLHSICIDFDAMMLWPARFEQLVEKVGSNLHTLCIVDQQSYSGDKSASPPLMFSAFC